MQIKENLITVYQQIKQICEHIQKDPQNCQIIGGQQTKSVADILQAYQAGQTAFGENYVQEGVENSLF